MKTLRNIFLALLLTVGGTAMADEYAYLTIDQTSGETSFSVSSIKRITFDSTYMVLHLADDTEQKLPLESLSKMFFSENGTNGIAAVQDSRQHITLKDGVLRVAGAAGQVVTVYDAAGKTVRQTTAGNAETELNLSGLVKGVYIVKVGAETKKVMNK